MHVLCFLAWLCLGMFRVLCVSLMPWLLMEGWFEHNFFSKDSKSKMEMNPYVFKSCGIVGLKN